MRSSHPLPRPSSPPPPPHSPLWVAPSPRLPPARREVQLNVSGSQWAPATEVTIDGVTFRAAEYTYMETYGVPSAGDWALERLDAVFLQGTERATLANCVFERLDGHGVMISGYNRNATVCDSDFAFLGGSAVASWGITNETEGDGHPEAGVDGIDGNHPQGNAQRRASQQRARDRAVREAKQLLRAGQDGAHDD